jgi:hypothetical protein
MIGTTETLDIAIGQIASPVSCSVEPCTTFAAKRIGNKSIRGQLWMVPIAARKTHAADKQFTRYANWNGVEVTI